MQPEIRTVEETGSTNDDVAGLAAAGAPEGLWLRADRQSGGRGRQGRPWQSPPGNLYASTLVRIRPGDPSAATLALVAGVALMEALRCHAPDLAAFLKWPNDVLVGGAKLSGILLERSGDAVVIGFGVNLAAQPRLRDRPVTSLVAAAGSAPHPADFLALLATRFGRWLDRWREEGLDVVRQAWLDAALPPGTELRADGVVGAFDGLDEQGGLQLRLADGSLRVIHAGDVFLV